MNYQRKPEIVDAMYWDGSKKSWLRIKEWMPKFLAKDSGPHCDYWENYDEAPPKELLGKNVYANGQVYDYMYRTIQFEAWGDDQEVNPHSWIIFRGAEDAHTDGSPVPIGDIFSDEEFRATYLSIGPEEPEGNDVNGL